MNKFAEIDPNFDEGVMSIKIDADAVNSKDDDLIHFLENTFRSIMPYLKLLKVQTPQVEGSVMI